MTAEADDEGDVEEVQELQVLDRGACCCCESAPRQPRAACATQVAGREKRPLSPRRGPSCAGSFPRRRHRRQRGRHVRADRLRGRHGRLRRARGAHNSAQQPRGHGRSAASPSRALRCRDHRRQRNAWSLCALSPQALGGERLGTFSAHQLTHTRRFRPGMHVTYKSWVGRVEEARACARTCGGNSPAECELSGIQLAALTPSHQRSALHCVTTGGRPRNGSV